MPSRVQFLFDPAFREAFENVGHRVYGYRLKPYSLWHRFCLEMLNSPVITGEPTSGLELYAAARVCCSQFGELPDLAPAKGLIRRLRLSARLRQYGLQAEAKKFQAYLEDFESGPKLWPDEGGSRSPKCSEMDQGLELAAHVIRETGWTQETVWNMPIGQLRWYSAAFLKISGTDVPFWTPQDEEQYKRHLAQREKMLAERSAEMAKAEGIDPQEARRRVEEAYWEDHKKAKKQAELRSALQKGTYGR